MRQFIDIVSQPPARLDEKPFDFLNRLRSAKPATAAAAQTQAASAAPAAAGPTPAKAAPRAGTVDPRDNENFQKVADLIHASYQNRGQVDLSQQFNALGDLATKYQNTPFGEHIMQSLMAYQKQGYKLPYSATNAVRSAWSDRAGGITPRAEEAVNLFAQAAQRQSAGSDAYDDIQHYAQIVATELPTYKKYMDSVLAIPPEQWHERTDWLNQIGQWLQQQLQGKTKQLNFNRVSYGS